MRISPLSAQLVRTIRDHTLFHPGDTVIVALSGGADSCALLDLLTNLPGIPLRLVAAHLNHCLRGTEADADEEFARALSSRHAIPFESRRVDVRKLARQEGLNLEDAGRKARFAFLDEVRGRYRAATVALAHHADDQAETVLMRLLRGSGMTGLSGMAYRNSRGYVRPLLAVSRAEIETYLRERGISWREDASNRDTAFLRNRIRHELLPLLERYNPAVRERLTTTASLLADEDALLERLAEDLAAQACTFDGGTVRCALGVLAGHPPPLVRRVFLQALQRLTGSRDHLSRRHLMALEQLAASPRPNAAVSLPAGIIARREYNLMLLAHHTAPEPPGMGEFTVTGPGSYSLPGGGTLTATLLDAAPELAARSRDTACFDPDKAPFPWLVRTFRPGDRITPLGMTGLKKVKNLFIDEKIPLPQRGRIPLVFSGSSLIWACGVRASQAASLDGASSRCIRAVYTPAATPIVL